MDELQARHRKELRDLQSRITQKKKQATKRTRKGIQDECERLEQELRQRHAAEIVAAVGGDADVVSSPDRQSMNDTLMEKLSLEADETTEQDDDADDPLPMAKKTVSSPTTNGAPLVETNGAQSPSPSTTSSSVGAGKRPNRAKARLARRAAEQEEMARQGAEEAQHLPNQKAAERERMQAYMQQHNLVEKEIRADGHCLYSAVADQLDQLHVPVGCTLGGKPVFGYRAIRAAAAAYIEQHGDEFAPFLEEPLDDYVRKVRDTAEWGGQLELLALAKTYGVEINVLQDFARVEKIEPDAPSADEKTIWLGYYKHGFGLGRHYNSLRKGP